MQFEWDNEKNQFNIEKHKLSFDNAIQLFENPLLINEDSRFNYKEKRYIGYGYISNRLMCVVYTERNPNIIRIISFRKANYREQEYYKKCKK
jgi:hypothetical protein